MRKKEKTWLRTLGVKNPNYSEVVKQRRRENFLRKRLPFVKIILESADLELLTEYTYAQDICKLLCKKCNTVFESCFMNILQGYGRCPKCYPNWRSIAEAEGYIRIGDCGNLRFKLYNESEKNE